MWCRQHMKDLQSSSYESIWGVLHKVSINTENACRPLGTPNNLSFRKVTSIHNPLCHSLPKSCALFLHNFDLLWSSISYEFLEIPYLSGTFMASRSPKTELNAVCLQPIYGHALIRHQFPSALVLRFNHQNLEMPLYMHTQTFIYSSLYI